MIGTESKLWSLLYKHKAAFKSLRRIESPITPGASDVEYVSPNGQGWVELKTCENPRPGKNFFLHTPFTTAQAAWLMDHTAPEQHLQSYLLLGVLGPRTWRELILLEPKAAMLLVAGWKGVSNEELRTRDGVHSVQTMTEVVAIILEVNKDVRLKRRGKGIAKHPLGVGVPVLAREGVG